MPRLKRGALEAAEVGKYFDGFALGSQRVFRRVGIGVTERHAAIDDFIVRDAEMGANRFVIVGKEGLRAGIKAACARCDHQVAQEHAAIDEHAFAEAVVERENQADRRVEENVVTTLRDRKSVV